MRRALLIFSFGIVFSTALFAEDKVRVLDEALYHLRIDGPREWSEFPERPDAGELNLRFDSKPNSGEWTLSLRQQDVKQTWNVLLNGKPLGRLKNDENEMRIYFPLPQGTILQGENRLVVRQQIGRRGGPDDIRVGEIHLIPRPMSEVLNESVLQVTVKDQDAEGTVPSRITITTLDGVLQTTGATSNDHLAVRAGTVFTSTGTAEIGLPAGRYRIYAGRGFEYSLASVQVTLKPGEKVHQELTIRREVPTPGYVACDTHIHTLTHSGHGDATVQERMVTVAAEGIELPIAADHNVQIDHRPFAREMQVERYFTPVIGNEVTTPVGHFNVFPVDPEAKPPTHRLDNWKAILEEIFQTPGVKVAILNHARDLHSGVRPFGPKRFNEAVGENVDGWPISFNAMEVVNSGAIQSDPLRLCEDWMALLNRGYQITPIGASDSHDVARHFVGQGRTYIRADDRDVSRIDVNEAVNNLLEGRVMVSYGLLAQIEVEGKYHSGELARVTGDEVQIRLNVLGPHWTKAREVRLYANGRVIREFSISGEKPRGLRRGVQWEKTFTIPRPKHDLHLVAIVLGAGVEQSYWKTAKPYQPTSPDWEPCTLGLSGAVWLDADGDGRSSSAYDYALKAFAHSKGDLPKLIEQLADYDAAVAAQSADLIQSAGRSLLSDEVQKALSNANPPVKQGFQDYIAAWRKTRIAKTQSNE